MRAITTLPAAALVTGSATIRRVLCIEWPGAAALYYTDGVPSWPLAAGYSSYEPIVQTWPQPAPAADTGVVPQGQFSSASFAMISDETADTPLRVRISQTNPMGARVTLYAAVQPLGSPLVVQLISDWIVLGVYRVVSTEGAAGIYTF